MKIVLRIFVFVLLFQGYNAHSQCTPLHFPGPPLLNPDTNQALAPAAATQLYSKVISVRIPADTVIAPFPTAIPIDSAGIISVTGLPTSMSYVTNSPSDYWPGGSYGCVLIQGTPAEADTGVYQVDVEAQVVGLGLTLALNYTYEFVVLDSIYAGITQVIPQDFSVVKVFPNPMKNHVKIQFSLLKNDNIDFMLSNAQGQIILNRKTQGLSGLNTIELSNQKLPKGIYFYTLRSSSKKIMNKIIVE